MALRVVYTDVDGTLVGPRGCFFLAEDSSPTLAPARAQLLEATLLLGADGFIAEMGALVCWGLGGDVAVLDGAGPPASDGAVEELLEHFSGRLELHDPWHLGHEVDVMLRGRVDPDEVEGWLADRELAHLRLLDNGILPRARVAGLAPGPVHVYHLMPAGIDKGRAVATDLARRGLKAEEAIAVGDSRSDLTMAPVVGRFYLTANGARQEGLGGTEGVRVTAKAVGEGWAEAVVDALGGADGEDNEA
jgi:hypothetical protein